MWPEIGRHIQNLRGLFGQLSIQKLQADCVAGTLATSAGPRELLQAGDPQEGAIRSSNLGILRVLNGFAPDAHGTTLQRRQAFTTGFLGGAVSSG